MVDRYMPEQFKEKYPSTRVVIDCTEIKCQMASSLLLNSELFSTYKNHTTSHQVGYFQFYKPAIYWSYLTQRNSTA